MTKTLGEAIGKVNVLWLTACCQKKTGGHPQTITANRWKAAGAGQWPGSDPLPSTTVRVAQCLPDLDL